MKGWRTPSIAMPTAGEIRRGRLARSQDQARILRLPRRQACTHKIGLTSPACGEREQKGILAGYASKREHVDHGARIGVFQRRRLVAAFHFGPAATATYCLPLTA